ncbi:GspH/FimT family pseudopilin [Billgrantia saliphila]|uniref:GspH/FimT family pseudopilin n=1 Tax=Billgrantia saliphila TaxID=1848458 RepID=UPI000CE2EB88|nr:GspH/FimT family pseudopilin [Halomonas saliphila]
MGATHVLRSGAGGQRGLTLLELLAVIAVAMLLLGWAVPGLQAMTARQEVAAEVHRLRTALSLARNTAIARRSMVTVCPSVDRTSCSQQHWNAPLAIVLGSATSGSFGDDDLLRLLEAGRGVTVEFRQDGKPVRYSALGRPAGHNGTFRICGRSGRGARLVLSNFGRVRLGEPLTC